MKSYQKQPAGNFTTSETTQFALKPAKRYSVSYDAIEGSPFQVNLCYRTAGNGQATYSDSDGTYPLGMEIMTPPSGILTLELTGTGTVALDFAEIVE